MREIVKKKRNTKSKFYEYFLTQYGSIDCYRDCIQSVSIRNDNTANVIKMNPVFETCLIESDEIVKGYMIIYAGLNDFYQSGIQNGMINFKACNLDYLQNIAIQFKNPIFKLARKMVLSSY